jgi:hypothetical protein
MRIASQISVGAMMRVTVLVAIELVLLRGVWFIVVFPPITMGVLAINLGLLFLMVRPRFLETRMLGMLLGGLAACFVTALGMFPGPNGIFDHLLNVLRNWAWSRSDPQDLTVRFLLFLIYHFYVVYFALLDVLGVAILWTGGWLENRWRRRRVRGAEAASLGGSSP